MRVSVLAVSAFLLTSCGPAKPPEMGTVKFTLSAAIPTSSLVEARLIELSGPDRRTVAKMEFPGEPRASVYQLAYPKNSVYDRYTYGVQVAILNGGTQIMVSSEAGRVLTQGKGDTVSLILVDVPPSRAR